MRIWTRKLALIQPRTSLWKSDVSLLCSWRAGSRQRFATTHHSFRGSFSAVSTPIFASKYAFFCIFRDLQENHLLASKFCKILWKNCKILQHFAIFCCRKLQNLLARRWFSCRSRKMLKDAYLDAKIGVDPAENTPIFNLIQWNSLNFEGSILSLVFI